MPVLGTFGARSMVLYQKSQSPILFTCCYLKLVEYKVSEVANG
jgi:hypothetical protein